MWWRNPPPTASFDVEDEGESDVVGGRVIEEDVVEASASAILFASPFTLADISCKVTDEQKMALCPLGPRGAGVRFGDGA